MKYGIQRNNRAFVQGRCQSDAKHTHTHTQDIKVSFIGKMLIPSAMISPEHINCKRMNGNIQRIVTLLQIPMKNQSYPSQRTFIFMYVIYLIWIPVRSGIVSTGNSNITTSITRQCTHNILCFNIHSIKKKKKTFPSNIFDCELYCGPFVYPHVSPIHFYRFICLLSLSRLYLQFGLNDGFIVMTFASATHLAAHIADFKSSPSYCFYHSTSDEKWIKGCREVEWVAKPSTYWYCRVYYMCL